MTRQSDRILTATMAEPIFAPADEGWGRWRAAEQAKQHLASLSPEYRAQLEQEWRNHA